MENSQRYYLTLINVMMIVLGLGAIVYILLFFDASKSNEAMIALFASVIGALVNQHSNSQQWWFGTTKGTADTTGVLREIASNALPSHPPTDPPTGTGGLE
jgi:hypothetical protein